MQYYVRIGPNWSPTDNVKMPGFSARTTDNVAPPGGNGGAGGGGNLSWSARSIVQAPNDKGYQAGGMGQYIYHSASTNAPYGESYFWNANLDHYRPDDPGAAIGADRWYLVKHHVKLNSKGSSNALVEGWVDGRKKFRVSGINLSNNDDYRDLAFWVNLFHGGKADTSGKTHEVLFADFEYVTGPVDHLRP